MEIAHEEIPEVQIHVSTQANNVNSMTFNFWHNYGAKRVVSARELSMSEIRKIRITFRLILKLRHLCMELCAFLIQAGAF